MIFNFGFWIGGGFQGKKIKSAPTPAGVEKQARPHD